jgi:hypothetical protein
LITSLEDSLRAISRRLRGVPRQSVQIALPKLQLEGFAVAPDLLDARSVVYSISAAPTSAFDLALAQRFGCKVHALAALPSVAVLDRMQWLMRSFGHRHVDLLRLDLDGAEYAAIDALAQTQLRPCQLVVGFHHGKPQRSVAQTERALMQLNELGYRIFDCQASGQQYSLALV